MAGSIFLRYLSHCVGLAFAFAILIVLNASSPVQAYTPDRAGGQAFATDFCNSNPNGVGDYVWLTSPSDSNTVTATKGDQYVNVKVNVTGKYCSWYGSEQSGSFYASSVGALNGSFNYNNNGAGNEFDDNQIRQLNITGWNAGNHRVCMSLSTWSINPNLTPQNSPPACSWINLVLITPWTTSAQTLVGVDYDPNVSNWSAGPGNVLYWRHTISASGGTTPGLGFAVGKSGFTGNAWGDGSAPNNIQPQGTTPAISAGSSYSIGWNVNRPEYSAYRVQQSDVGNTLCQSISWGPTAYDNGNWSQSGPACVSVPYKFNLTPSIDSLGREFGDQGGTIPTVTARVKNDGPTKSYDGTNWQLSTIIVKPGGSVAGAADNRQDGCAYYGNTCSSLNGSGPTFMPPDSTQVAQLVNQQIGDLEVGSQLCYGLSVMAYNQGQTNASGWWRHSAPQCVVIGKRPKVQVWGSDLMVGRRFSDDVTTPVASTVDVSTSTKDNGTKTFGSWIEYGVFASSTITGGSAAGLAGQDGNSSSNQLDWSKLTFANSGQTADSGCTSTGFGCYAKAGAMGVIPDVVTRLAPGKSTDTPQVGNGALDSLNGTYYAAGGVTITGSAIAKGKSVIIRAAGTVRITGDIRYTSDTMSSISDIPQVVIIANNIIIDDNVTNVDAWLIANGASGGIYTCGDLKAVLTSKVCDKQLTVNGPVMSKKLFLQRTAGSGTGTKSGDPAEVLNLRTDAYLWAISHAGGAGGIQTVDTHELAPRF